MCQNPILLRVANHFVTQFQYIHLLQITIFPFTFAVEAEIHRQKEETAAKE